MSELEQKVLDCLCENSHYTNKEISLIVNASEKEVKEIIEKLENNGTILKYGAVLNLEENKKVNAFIEVKVTPQAMYGFDKIAVELCQFNEIKSMYLMSGACVLALFVEGDNLIDISNFISEKLSQIDGIVNVSTHFVLKNYKVDGAICLKVNDRERQIAL